MSRAISKSKLQTAIASAQAAGLVIQAIEFPPDGGFKLVFEAEPTQREINEWDIALGLAPAS